MTEKRFDFEEEYITLDCGVFATAKNKHDAELISKTLNQLYSESEELKHQVNYLEDRLDDMIVLKKENEKLKQAYTQLKHRHSLLHDVCIVECDRDSYRKDITSWVNDYIQDHTIKVDKLPVYGNDKLIYQLPNKLEYIYFKKKWECIGKVEE